MSGGDPQDPLRDLGRRLDAAQAALGKKPPDTVRASGAGAGGNALAFGLRIGTELVVAILVATGIGWAIDHWLGTRPWGMIAMFFLGVAAGMLNVWRAVAGMGMAVGYRRRGESRDGGGEAKSTWDDED